jgi:hypothetical protein
MDLIGLLLLTLLNLLSPRTSEYEMLKDGSLPAISEPAPSSLEGDGGSELDPLGGR